MAKPAFPELHRLLISGGVSPRRVERLVRELQDHHAQLILERKRAGSSDPEAEASARLGTDDALARQFLARPELQSWSRRWPWAIYIIAPLPIFSAAFVATVAATAGLGDIVVPQQSHSIPSALLRVLAIVRLFSLYALPVLAALGFALLASRRGVSRTWAWASIALPTLFGALPTFDFDAHRISAGIGISTRIDFLKGILLYRWLPTAAAAAILYGLTRISGRRIAETSHPW